MSIPLPSTSEINSALSQLAAEEEDIIAVGSRNDSDQEDEDIPQRKKRILKQGEYLILSIKPSTYNDDNGWHQTESSFSVEYKQGISNYKQIIDMLKNNGVKIPTLLYLNTDKAQGDTLLDYDVIRNEINLTASIRLFRLLSWRKSNVFIHKNSVTYFVVFLFLTIVFF